LAVTVNVLAEAPDTVSLTEVLVAVPLIAFWVTVTAPVLLVNMIPPAPVNWPVPLTLRLPVVVLTDNDPALALMVPLLLTCCADTATVSATAVTPELKDRDPVGAVVIDR